MGRHRVYSARARGAFAPRAGQQRQHMRGRGSTAGVGWNAARAAKTTRMWQAAAKRRRFMCFPRDSARVCCEERAQARRQAHHASRLVVARKESSGLMRRTAGMAWSGKAAPSSGFPFHRSSNERMTRA